MRIAAPKETASGERRVALVPEVVHKLCSSGWEVTVEPGAGTAALIPDESFQAAGASLGAPWDADVVAKVAPPSGDEIGRLGAGSMLVGFLEPYTNTAVIGGLARAGATAFALEAIPRISRAQSMDALSSQSNVAGYRSVLLAASEMGRFFPGLMTAAGSVKPATVLVLGVGVAGLQAIATARRLGATVVGFDVREEVREQVQSLGAKWLQLEMAADGAGEGGYAKELGEAQQDKQRRLLAKAMEVADVDAVITTALIPGRPAPLLVTEEAVRRLKPGSVVVDLAAETGGNCELTRAGETVVAHDCKIVGPRNLASAMPEHASQLYARNIQSLVSLMVGDDGDLAPDFDDEVIAGACIVRGGEIVNDRARGAVEQAGGSEQAGGRVTGA